ncbi:makorin, ring finger protein, 4 [Polymixia lowei]
MSLLKKVHRIIYSNTETTAAAAGGGGAAASLGDQEEGAASSGDQQETEAFLQSKDVTCGICMDKVYEKMRADERRFGILPNCNHSFCLRCIVTWRKTKDLQEDVVKSCPQCRVKSAFYVPHNYWVEGQAKKTLIATFKEECSKKRCSFFMRHGYCPFKSECIYWHDKGQWPHSHLHQTENIDDLESLIRGLSIAMAFLADGSDDDDDDDDDYYFFI